MWTWIFQIVLCIIILWTGHSLWNYFLQKFSKQKTRDLVNIHTEKYKSMINELTNQIQIQTQIQSQIEQTSQEPSPPLQQYTDLEQPQQTHDLHRDLEQLLHELTKTI